MKKYNIIIKEIICNSKEEKDAVVSFFALCFNINEEEVKKYFKLLPVIIFENLDESEIKTLRDNLIFLSKLGIKFEITSNNKKFNYTKTNWKLKINIPLFRCPTCGEYFCIIKPQDILGKKYDTLKDSQDLELSAEIDEIEALSRELKGIVGSEKDLFSSKSDEIEELGSISEEVEEIGSISQELEELDQISREELKNIQLDEDEFKDEISSISGEFEEIEGISAELKKISVDMEDNVGSLSAELELGDESEEFSTLENGIRESSMTDERIGEIQNRLNSLENKKDNMRFKSKLEDEIDFFNEDIDKWEEFNNFNVFTEKGPYKVVVKFLNYNFESIKFLSSLKGITYKEAENLVKKHSSLIVASNVSKKSAEEIIKKFKSYKQDAKIYI